MELNRRNSIGLRLVLALVAAVLVAACQGSALGFDRAPASLDPASPSISASDIAFDRSEIAVPAGQAFTLVFDNREAVPHNVSIYVDSSLKGRRFEGQMVTGPATRWYPVPALTAGTYFFQCDMHPSMAGRIVAS
jgi:plastocyanin